MGVARGHPCPRGEIPSFSTLSMMLTTGFFVCVLYQVKPPSIPSLLGIFVMNVWICQMFFLCLLIWSYGFSSDVIDYINWFKMLNDPCILGVNLLKLCLLFSDKMFKYNACAVLHISDTSLSLEDHVLQLACYINEILLMLRSYGTNSSFEKELISVHMFVARLSQLILMIHRTLWRNTLKFLSILGSTWGVHLCLVLRNYSYFINKI